jgi:hypothetical protein
LVPPIYGHFLGHYTLDERSVATSVPPFHHAPCTAVYSLGEASNFTGSISTTSH